MIRVVHRRTERLRGPKCGQLDQPEQSKPEAVDRLAPREQPQGGEPRQCEAATING